MSALELSGRPLLATTRDSRLFVDRDEEVEAIKSSLTGHMNLLLLGERGAGKTTLLHQVSRHVERSGWRAIFVEGGLATSPTELLSLIRARVSPEAILPSASQQLGELIGTVQELTRSRAVRRRPAGDTGGSELLLDSIRVLHDDLQDEERPCAVLVDEVRSPEIVHAVFGRLRDEIWQLPVVWLVTGDLADRNIYLRPPADAFFARVITLRPLNEDAALGLLRTRIPRARARDRLLKAIVAASSRTPRDLIRLASQVVVGGVPPEEVAGLREKQDAVLESLGDPALRIVAELEAHGPASASDEAFLARLGFGRSRAAQIFAELERLGVVEAAPHRVRGQRPRKVYALKEIAR